MMRLLVLLSPAFLCAPLCLAELAVTNAKFHEFEGGPIIASDTLFRGGDTVFLSFQVSGFQTTGEDEDQVRLTYQIRATDSTGRLIAETKEGKVEVDLAPEDKKRKWIPRIHYSVLVPQGAAPGVYTFHISVQDTNAKTEASKDANFSVGGHVPMATQVLSVQNFQFQRSDKETDVLPSEGSFRPGDTLWAAFDITGYKFGEKNRYAISYGLSLIDGEGKVLFSEPKAASESEESFYPKEFVPAILNLKLDPKMPPGTYVLSLHVTDTAGKQEIDSPHTFKVEK